jgi:hypothetical protein
MVGIPSSAGWPLSKGQFSQGGRVAPTVCSHPAHNLTLKGLVFYRDLSQKKPPFEVAFVGAVREPPLHQPGNVEHVGINEALRA